MDAATTALLLLLIGLVLIVAEVFIPSGGAISVCSALKFVLYLTSLSILIPIGIGLAFWFLPHTPVGKAAILSGPTREETEAFGDVERKHQSFVGKTGVTVTILNPAGTLKIDGERINCQSEGMIIAAGETVRVVSARVNYVVVRQVAPEDLVGTAPPAPEEPSTAEPEKPAAREPSSADIDFDLT